MYFLLRELCFRFGTSVTVPAWLLADLDYRYVEQPLRERGRRLAGSFGQRWKYRQLPVNTPALLPSPGPAGEGR